MKVKFAEDKKGAPLGKHKPKQILDCLSVAYNQNVHLIGKLSFWVCLRTRRIAK